VLGDAAFGVTGNVKCGVLIDCLNRLKGVRSGACIKMIGNFLYLSFKDEKKQELFLMAIEVLLGKL
jgi:hypothetical protein